MNGVIPLRTKVDKLCWMKNEIGNTCININYAKDVTNHLNIDSSSTIIGELNDHIIRTYFAPSSAIRWYLMDDPVIDYYYYNYAKRGIEIRNTRKQCSAQALKLGLVFEDSIYVALKNKYQSNQDITLIDLEDIPMNKRIDETLRVLQEGCDIILNGLVVGVEYGIYGAPDIIMKKKHLHLLDKVMNVDVEFIPILPNDHEYVIIEIKYSKLKTNSYHQCTSRRMRFYQGQAYLYALALQEMLQLDYTPESYILPDAIRRYKKPLMNIRYNNIIYRNYSCIPVDQKYIHQPLMEALGWNVFISEYHSQIHPLYMFIANSVNKLGDDYLHIKKLHRLNYGALELYMTVSKTSKFRANNIFTIHDPRIRSSDVVNTGRIIDYMRFDILRSRNRHYYWIQDKELDILRTTKDQIIVYRENEDKSYVVNGVPKSNIYIRQDFDNSIFVVASDSDVSYIQRTYGHSSRSIIVISIQSILDNALVVIPGLYSHDIMAISHALFKNNMIPSQINQFVTPEEHHTHRMQANALVLYQIWTWLKNIAN